MCFAFLFVLFFFVLGNREGKKGGPLLTAEGGHRVQTKYARKKKPKRKKGQGKQGVPRPGLISRSWSRARSRALQRRERWKRKRVRKESQCAHGKRDQHGRFKAKHWNAAKKRKRMQMDTKRERTGTNDGRRRRLEGVRLEATQQDTVPASSGLKYKNLLDVLADASLGVEQLVADPQGLGVVGRWAYIVAARGSNPGYS
jgi:hypothetical protein